VPGGLAVGAYEEHEQFSHEPAIARAGRVLTNAPTELWPRPRTTLALMVTIMHVPIPASLAAATDPPQPGR
jgi:hypothetical protein